MTQKYYTEKLLPEYINIISRLRIDEDWWILLQEDGDLSHST